MAPRLTIERLAPELLTVRLAGTWRIDEPVPTVARLRRELDEDRPNQLAFDTREVLTWDSALVAFSANAMAIARAADVAVDRSGLPLGVQRLLALAEAAPKRPARPAASSLSWVARIGTRVIEQARRVKKAVTWVGELTIAFTHLVSGQVRFRRTDLVQQMQLTGTRVLSSVTLIAAVLGMILAHVGAEELAKYGAASFVAKVVGVGIVRELAPLMAAIVVAGRAGAEFVFDLRGMRATREIDALTVWGISPVEVLALPRILAAMLMLPLLCIYANAVGLVAGAMVGIRATNVAPEAYIEQTLAAVSAHDLLGGILKSIIYGFAIGAAACHDGLRAVGAATSGALNSIVLVVVMFVVSAVIF